MQLSHYFTMYRKIKRSLKKIYRKHPRLINGLVSVGLFRVAPTLGMRYLQRSVAAEDAAHTAAYFARNARAAEVRSFAASNRIIPISRYRHRPSNSWIRR